LQFVKIGEVRWSLGQAQTAGKLVSLPRNLFWGKGCHYLAGSREDVFAGTAGEIFRRRELDRDWLSNRPGCRPPIRSFPGGIAPLRPLILLCISIATKETQHASDRSACRFSGTHLVD
jgi:hypothetical protein